MGKGEEKEKFLNFFIDRFICNIQRNPSEDCVSFNQIKERAEHSTTVYFNSVAAGDKPESALEKAFAILFDGYTIDEFSYFK